MRLATLSDATPDSRALVFTPEGPRRAGSALDILGIVLVVSLEATGVSSSLIGLAGAQS